MSRTKQSPKRKTQSRARRKRLTPNQKAYQSELQRLIPLVESMLEEGYIIPDLNVNLSPNRIYKKDIAYLKSLTEESIAEKSDYLNPTSNEFIPGAEIYKANQIATQFQIDTELGADFFPIYQTIVDTFKEEISNYPTQFAFIVNKRIDFLISKYGLNTVAIGLRDAPEQLHEYLSSGAYANYKEAVNAYFQQVINYMPELTEEEQESIIDSLEWEALDYEIR